MNCDKQLFVKYRDREITFDQLKARTSETNGMGKYVVIDDFQKILEPIMKDHDIEKMRENGELDKYDSNKTIDEIINPDSNRITNPKCLRSLNFDNRKKVAE